MTIPVILALGSNLGDRLGMLRAAREQLAAVLDGLAVAPVYESAPRYVTDQPAFLNSALRGVTALTPHDLLCRLKAIETGLGRIVRRRYGPREIDLDIVYYGNAVLDTADLQLPHPLRLERRFVLQPVASLAPDFLDPVAGVTVAALLARLPPDPDMRLYDEQW